MRVLLGSLALALFATCLPVWAGTADATVVFIDNRSTEEEPGPGTIEMCLSLDENGSWSIWEFSTNRFFGSVKMDKLKYQESPPQQKGSFKDQVDIRQDTDRDDVFESSETITAKPSVKGKFRINGSGTFTLKFGGSRITINDPRVQLYEGNECVTDAGTIPARPARPNRPPR